MRPFTRGVGPRAAGVMPANLGPIAQLRAGRLGRRIPQLLLGLVLFGATLAMMVRGGLGLSPWDVFHSGLIQWVPLTFGQANIAVAIVLLLIWIPLRERPGLGTLLNAVLVGLAMDATLAVLPAPQALWARVVLMLAGIVGNAFASALYIGSEFGRGPRDGLMTGLARVSGRSLGLVRTAIELSVVLLGLLLDLAAGSGRLLGGLGVGTVGYALAIGPLTQAMLPRWLVPLAPSAGPGRPS